MREPQFSREYLEAEVKRLAGCLLILSSATKAPAAALRQAALEAATKHAEPRDLAKQFWLPEPLKGASS